MTATLERLKRYVEREELESANRGLIQQCERYSAQLASARKALENLLRRPVDIDDRPTDPTNPTFGPTFGLYLKISKEQYAAARAALSPTGEKP